MSFFSVSNLEIGLAVALIVVIVVVFIVILIVLCVCCKKVNTIKVSLYNVFTIT